MAKVNVESVGAIVDGRPIGSKFELDERTAERLAAIKYVRIIGKVAEVKKTTTPPKRTTKTAPKKTGE